MSSNANSVSTPASNPIVLGGIIVVAVLFAAIVTGYNVAGLGLLMGLIVFVFFVRNPEYGVYATTALLLLQGSSGVLSSAAGMSNFELTIAQLCGAASMAAWVVNALVFRAPLHMNAPMLYLAAFCLWALFGTVLSGAPDELPHWARMFFRFALLVLAVNTLDSAEKVNRYLHVLILCAIITSLVSIAQYIVPDMQLSGFSWASVSASGAYVDQESLSGEAAVRVSGQAGHSNWLALMLILLIPLNAFWFAMTQRRWLRIAIVAAVFLQVAVVALTFTRTGFIIGGLVFAMLVSFGMLRVSPTRIFAMLLIGVIGFTLLPDSYKERVFSPRQYVASKSVQARFSLQSAALRYGFENPIFGLGTGGFGENFITEGSETATQMRYIVQYGGWLPVFIGTHNMYLQVLADTGFVGLILYAAFYYLAFRNLVAARRRYIEDEDHIGQTTVTALMISLTAFIVYAVFLHALHQPIWWMIAAAAIAIPLHRIDFKHAEDKISPTPILLS